MCDLSYVYSAEDIFDEISSIRDPERTHATLNDLRVVSVDRCHILYDDAFVSFGNSTTLPPSLEPTGAFRERLRTMRQKLSATITVTLLPTVPHCHLMHWICLSVVARLRDVLPVTTAWRIVVKIVPGSHQQWEELERQAQDKERVAAALDNPAMLKEIRKLINPHSD